MSDTPNVFLGSRLRGSASWVFAKFHSTSPLLTLPAIGLVAWFATPYFVKLAEGRSVVVADPGDVGGTTTAPRTHTPTTMPGAGTTSGAAPVASLLGTPVTASMMPSWLPLPLPAPSQASGTVPPQKTVQRPAPQASRPKATARIIERKPQQQVAVLQSRREQHRSAVNRAPAVHTDLPFSSRGVAVAGGFQRPMNGFGAPQTPFGFQQHFNPNPGGFAAPRSFGGGFHGGGHR